MREQPKPSRPQDFKQALVDMYLMSIRDQKKQDEQLERTIQSQAIAMVQSFFGMTDEESKEVELYKLEDRYFAEFRGIRVMAHGPQAVSLVGTCPYCKGDAVSSQVVSNHADLGGLVFASSNQHFDPDQWHLDRCKKAPNSVKPTFQLQPKEEESVLDMLARVLSKRMKNEKTKSR